MANGQRKTAPNGSTPMNVVAVRVRQAREFYPGRLTQDREATDDWTAPVREGAASPRLAHRLFSIPARIWERSRFGRRLWSENNLSRGLRASAGDSPRENPRSLCRRPTAVTIHRRSMAGEPAKSALAIRIVPSPGSCGFSIPLLDLSAKRNPSFAGLAGVLPFPFGKAAAATVPIFPFASLAHDIPG